MKAVELKNIYFRYKGFKEIILKNVNMEALYGEITLIAGMSGSGKSTILNLITGIIPNIIKGDIKGEILINNENIIGKSISEISKMVGVVLQNADSQIIMPHVEEEIAFGLENINMERENIKNKINEMCNILSLNKNAKSKTLSGGEKQRLMSGAILAMGQKIIILDEPLANIDKFGAKILLDALNDLKNNGYAIIIIEHRLDMLIKYIDKIYDIKNGILNEIDNINKYLEDEKNIIKDNGIKIESNEKIYEVNNLIYKIKDKTIINNISFDINEGERVLILGENGKGKTTLVRLLSKMIKPTEGDIKQYITNKKRNWFNEIGIVYQNPNYQLFMPTVEKEILYNAKSKELAYELLNKFDLEKYKNRHPLSLSEGEKRKLTVALVLARLPKVLFLDEPTVGQDYDNLLNMINIINEFRNKYKTTIITISHDIRCANSLCDKCIILDNELKIGNKELIDEFFRR